MAISRTWAKKAPSQDPTAFYKMKPSGMTTPGSSKAGKVPDKLTGGPMLEKIAGRKDLGDFK